MAKIAICVICLLFTLVGSLSSTDVACSYRNSDFWAAYLMYNCYVDSQLDIYTPEDAEITKATGSHMSGKSSDSEVVFYSYNKNIHYFPRGLEKVFKNLNGIILYTEPINFIQQSDLKSYTNLVFLQIADTKIEILEDGLFDFNPNLKYLALNENKIIHIGSKVFDNLNNLVSLYLDKNKCIDRKISKSQSGVIEIIKAVKSQCMSTEFFGLDEKFLKLDEESKNLNRGNLAAFERKVKNLEDQFLGSKFANFTVLKDKLEKLKNVNIEGQRGSGDRLNVSKIGMVVVFLSIFGKVW